MKIYTKVRHRKRLFQPVHYYRGYHEIHFVSVDKPGHITWENKVPAQTLTLKLDTSRNTV